MDCHHPKVQEACDAAQQFCSRWIFGERKGAMLIFVGNPGCGKTRLLKAVERFCRGGSHLAHKERSKSSSAMEMAIPSVLYMFWPTIADDLRENRLWPVSDAIETDLLLWDDLGAENDPWKAMADKACQILSRRENKFTIITTNIQPANWGDKFDQRIADRFLRNSVIVDLSEVPSYAML